MPAVKRVREGEQHVGDARQGAADHRQEVDERDPQRPQPGERHADIISVTNTTSPQIIEVRKFPSMYPTTERFTSDAIADASSA